jgi:hypothetical protein
MEPLPNSLIPEMRITIRISIGDSQPAEVTYFPAPEVPLSPPDPENDPHVDRVLPLGSSTISPGHCLELAL